MKYLNHSSFFAFLLKVIFILFPIAREMLLERKLSDTLSADNVLKLFSIDSRREHNDSANKSIRFHTTLASSSPYILVLVSTYRTLTDHRLN
jgi:hypothetical protein